MAVTPSPIRPGRCRPDPHLLVANRGEIARRIMRTARAMGIATVAVYSDADADGPHVGRGRPGGPAARRRPRPTPTCATTCIIDAARRTGADAVHPGYGFLSEYAALRPGRAPTPG